MMINTVKQVNKGVVGSWWGLMRQHKYAVGAG